MKQEVGNYNETARKALSKKVIDDIKTNLKVYTDLVDVGNEIGI